MEHHIFEVTQNNSNLVDSELEENTLLESAQIGDNRSIEKLYKKNKPILYYARNIYKTLLPVEDIDGCYGLAFTKALNTFNPKKRATFSTYLSYLLIKEIQSEIPKNSFIYIPANLRPKVYKVNIALQKQGITLPTEVEIRYEMEKLGYDQVLYNTVKEALPFIALQYGRNINYNEDYIWTEVDSTYRNGSGDLLSEYSLTNTYKTIFSLLNEALELYCEPNEKEEIKTILHQVMYSSYSTQGCLDDISNFYNCKKTNSAAKLTQALNFIKDYLTVKGLNISDFL